MREAWTDERLDDLNHRMDERFNRMDERFDRMDDRFDRVDERFQQVDQRFRQVDERFSRVEQDIRDLRAEMNFHFAALQRTMLQIGGGMLATLIVGFASLLVALH